MIEATRMGPNHPCHVALRRSSANGRRNSITIGILRTTSTPPRRASTRGFCSHSAIGRRSPKITKTGSGRRPVDARLDAVLGPSLGFPDGGTVDESGHQDGQDEQPASWIRRSRSAINAAHGRQTPRPRCAGARLRWAGNRTPLRTPDQVVARVCGRGVVGMVSMTRCSTPPMRRPDGPRSSPLARRTRQSPESSHEHINRAR